MDAQLPPRLRPLVALVDDDPALLNALAFALETDGFRVAPFLSAEAMLQAPPAEPQCFILDEKLSGISGLDLLERLRRSGAAAPALLITTNPSRATRRRAELAGVEIVEKPLLGDALARRIRALIPAD